MDRFSDFKHDMASFKAERDWRGSDGLKLQCVRSCHVFHSSPLLQLGQPLNLRSMMTNSRLSRRTAMIEVRHRQCVKRGSHSFTCHSHTGHWLYSPVEWQPPFGWYSLHLPRKAWPGWVDKGGCLHTAIYVPHRELNPDTVTHPNTLQPARRGLTSLIKTNALPLRQTIIKAAKTEECQHVISPGV